jgi:hypothetical protein
MNKIAVYTVMVGDYEDVIIDQITNSNYDYYMVTDDKDIKLPPNYKLLLVDKSDEPKKYSRKLKLLIHRYLKDYDTYIYLDANYKIIADLSRLLIHHTKDMVIKKHPQRNCIYQEGKRIIEVGKDSKSTVENHLNKYKDIVKQQSGLYENGFFIRNNSEKVNNFYEIWYNEIEQGSYRDQISLPYVLKTNTDIEFVTINNYHIGGYLRLQPHKKSLPTPIIQRKKRTTAIQVHYLTPASSDKNLGKQYNIACQNIKNDDDWICLRDGDTMFLTPDWMTQIEDIIENYGDKYDLISCYTNRLGLKHQLYQGKISTDFNVYTHLKIAEQLRDQYWDTVVESPTYTAGLFMLFKKSLHHKIPFSNGLTSANGKQIFVDADFSQRVLANGYKIGLAKGIYLFHAYRIHQPDMRSFSHLL